MSRHGIGEPVAVQKAVETPGRPGRGGTHEDYPRFAPPRTIRGNATARSRLRTVAFARRAA